MPTKLRHALGVLLILAVAAGAGGAAAMHLQELLEGLRTGRRVSWRVPACSMVSLPRAA